jgi:hypothetical protein
MDLDRDPLLKQILTDAIYRDEVRIYGDGLEYMYYVYITDAIQGILKTLFTNETKGKVYAITNPEEISILTIVNKVLALQPNAQRIKFIKQRGSVDPLYEKAYIPDENLIEIGWKPNVSFDRGISQVFDYFRKDVSLKEQSGNQNFLDSRPDSELPNNDSIRFVFDDTINLANRFFGPTYEAEHKQFQEFQKKLNNNDSPLYNLNKKNSSVMPTTPQTEIRTSNISKPKTKWFYIKALLKTAIFMMVYIFFIVPVVRFGLLFWKINTTVNSLDSYITSNSKGSPEKYNLETETRRDFAGIRWVINSLNLEKTENNLTSISRGLDNAVAAKSSIDQNNLGDYLISKEKVQESSVTKIQDLLLLLNAAKTQLEPESNSLPFNSSKAVNIKKWAFDTETKYSEKIKTN